MKSKETLEEWLQRGGKIKKGSYKAPPESRPYSRYKKKDLEGARHNEETLKKFVRRKK